MSERRDGWYWVRTSGMWETVEKRGYSYYVTGSQSPRCDRDFDKIGPRIPTPDEPWQCVPKEPTKAMRMEFHRTNELCEDGEDDGSGSPDYQWRAMLGAAPSPDATP